MEFKWRIFYTKNAQDDFLMLSREVQQRIAKKIQFFSAASNPLKFADALHDKYLGSFRFRIGDYRIIFDANSVKKERNYYIEDRQTGSGI